jgi:putative DNA primase/helicase
MDKHARGMPAVYDSLDVITTAFHPAKTQSTRHDAPTQGQAGRAYDALLGGHRLPRMDKETISQALTDRAEDLFQDAWGEPAKAAAPQWRAKSSSARAMWMRGAKRGQWKDFQGRGGDILQFFAVEFCGLSRAADDFPRVLAEAAGWCGISPDAPAPDPAHVEAKRREREKLELIEAAQKAAQDAALIAALRAKAKEAMGSPAGAYLASRGVTAMPQDAIAFLPPLKPQAGILHPKYSALIVWGRNEAGQIVGGQRILILDDGSKAAEKDRKPSFGNTSGHPARFAAAPGNETKPLVIAEGPETALSIWQVTGLEVWAVFGVSGFATAPLPTDRQIILCPDQDAPESPAGKAFAVALDHHLKRGADIWIAHAPEPEGSKRDLNDTLQRAGAGAVAKAIAGATQAAAPPQHQSAPQAAGNARLKLPPAAMLEDRRPRALQAALIEATTETVLGIAVAVAHQMQWRAPLIHTPQGIIDYITKHAPAGILSAAEISALLERILWLQNKRKSTAVEESKIRRHDAARHNCLTVTDLAHVRISDHLSGVLIVKAPMGSGKTQTIGKPFIDQAKANQKTVMAIAHRVTLIGELAQRLNLPDYRTRKAGDIAAAGAVAVCLPSTARADIREEMPAAQYLFIDEVSQVLKFLEAADYCRAGGGTSRDVYNRLEQLVRDAEAVIVADADIDARTLLFLEKCRPNEQFTIVTMEERATDKRALMHRDIGAVLDAISLELMTGGKVWLACESAHRARYYADKYRREGHKVLCITAENKMGPDETAFLANPETISRAYDIVVSSPVISSGMSIEHKGAPHFTLGAYIGCGTSTDPREAKQSLGRVRYLTRFLTGLDYSNLTGGQNVEGIKAGAEGAAEIERAPIAWTNFDSYAAGIKAEAANAKADFAAGLWWVLEAAGWQLERPEDPEDTSKKHIATEAAKAGKDARALELIEAEPMNRHQSDLMGKAARNQPMEIRYQASQMRAALGKLDLTRADVDFWDNGRGRSKIAGFEDLIGAEVFLPQDSEILSARRFRDARRNLLPALFSGIDLRGKITAEQATMVLDRVMTKPEVFAAAGIVGAKYRAQYKTKDGRLQPVKRPERPGQELRDILARCGLDVIEKRERSVPKLSLLDTREDSFGTKSERGYTYQIPPESWQNMVEILERRGSFDIDAAMARANCHLDPDPSPEGSSFDALAMAAAAPNPAPLPDKAPAPTPERATQPRDVVSQPDTRQDAERPPQRLVRAGGFP